MADKKSVIAKALLEGHDLRQALMDSEASPASVDYELRRAEKDPILAAATTLARRIDKRDWVLAIQKRLWADRGQHDVPVVNRIEPMRFFRDYYHTNRPVVLTGLVADWPALSRWSMDYLNVRFGHRPVEIQAMRNGSEDYELAKDRHKRTVRLGEVIDAIRETDASNDFYVTAYNDTTNKETLAELWDDLGPISVLRPSGGREGFFWLGPKGTLTPFHHDLTNNLLVQIIGRKRVRLVPPWEVGRMDNRIHCFSDRSLEALMDDPEGPTLLEATIGPGEAIFLPIGWWHHVEALDASISMSFTNFTADNNFHLGYPADPRF